MPNSSKPSVRLRVLIALGVVLVAATLALVPSASASGPGQARIIGGSTVDDTTFANRWSFMVALFTPNNAENWYPNIDDGQFCGASLVAPRVVVTAAHCMVDDEDTDGYPAQFATTSEFRMLVGRHNIHVPNDNSVPAGGQILHAARYLVHKDYRGSAGDFQNDVAVIITKEAVTAPGVTPIPLIGTTAGDNALWGANNGVHGVGADDALPNEAGPWIAGWGAVDLVPPPNTTYAQDLQAVDIPLRSNGVCTSGANARGGGFHAATMLCGGTLDTDGSDTNNNSTGTDTCQGDSGGPMIVWGGLSGTGDSDPVTEQGGAGEDVTEWRLAGLTSWGYGCADSKSYGFYTRLGNTSLNSFVRSQGIDLAGSYTDPTGGHQTSATVKSVHIGFTPSVPTPAFYSVWLQYNGDYGAWQDCHSTSCTITGLHGGRSYKVYLTSVSDSNYTHESYGAPEFTITTLKDSTKPSKPGKPAKRSNTKRSITLKWKHATDNDGVKSYEVWWRKGSHWKKLKTVSGSVLKYTKGGLKRGKAYKFRVRALDWSGHYSRWSSTGTLRTRS